MGSRWQRVDPDGPAILAALFDEQWVTATALLLMLRKTGLTLAYHDLWYRLRVLERRRLVERTPQRVMVGYDGRSRVAYGWRRKRTMPMRLAL